MELYQIKNDKQLINNETLLNINDISSMFNTTR